MSQNPNFAKSVLDYGVWALMKKYIFDVGARTKEACLAAIEAFFSTHQSVIRDCILGSVQ